MHSKNLFYFSFAQNSTNDDSRVLSLLTGLRRHLMYSAAA